MKTLKFAIIGVGNIAGIHAVAIREHRPPLIDGREGRRCVEVVEAVYRSAHSGAAVEPPPAAR